MIDWGMCGGRGEQHRDAAGAAGEGGVDDDAELGALGRKRSVEGREHDEEHQGTEERKHVRRVRRTLILHMITSSYII